ncbi:MAG TPA: tetratricopeptide repeat protein [Terriglobales bacterium]|nr:tetratricopeptide repeat protein [Terriglobales bacterium]
MFVGAASTAATPTPSSAPPARRLVPSVAVLPFADLSPARDQGYFCDGLAQELLDALGRVDGLAVASRASSFLFGPSADVRAIGERLNVSAVLEGSVRKDGTRLRVSVQLVDTADNYRLWSGTFDRRTADVFAVQEEIAARVTLTLGAVMKDAARRAAPRTDADAYDCYLRGRSLCGRPSGARLEAARQLYRRAIGIDPAYAPGWAGLADCDTFLYLYWGAPAGDLAEADDASRQALELGAELAECHAARACVLATLGQAGEADAAFRTALRLKPRLAKIHYLYGRFCFAGGALAPAAHALERAVALSPDEAHLWLLLAKITERQGRADVARRAHERTVAAAERQAAVDGDDERIFYVGARALVALGEHGRGIEWAERAVAMAPDDAAAAIYAAGAYARARRAPEALALLERGVDAGFRHAAWLRADPDFDAIRRHPRFDALVATMRPPARARAIVRAGSRRPA